MEISTHVLKIPDMPTGSIRLEISALSFPGNNEKFPIQIIYKWLHGMRTISSQALGLKMTSQMNVGSSQGIAVVAILQHLAIKGILPLDVEVPFSVVMGK